MKGPPVVGLLGGIGSGKSAVADLLRGLGCIISDADELAHRALADPAVIESLRERWGEEVIGEDGLPARGVIGSIVFVDEDERAWLESVIHPRVTRDRAAAFAAAPGDAPALVIDAPLILETGLERECDHLVFIEVPRDERLARVARTRGWNEAELLRREQAQLEVAQKRLKADFILENSGELAGLEERVRSLLQAILEAHSCGP